MNKVLSNLFLLLIVSCSAYSQQYFPLLDSSNIWTIVGNGQIVAPHQTNSLCSYPYGYGYETYDYITTNDTLINGRTYKTISLSHHIMLFSCDFGYVREDTSQKKVYFIDNVFHPEILLYDFSLNVGDSMLATITIPGTYFANGYYRVDSISTISVAAGNRRVFHLSNHSTSWASEMTWIEGIGCMENPFYPYASNSVAGGPSCPGSFHHSIEYVSCFEHQSKVYYDSCAFATAFSDHCYSVFDSCSYFEDGCGGVNELRNLKTFFLSPNPTRGETEINFEISVAGEYEFSVISMTGNLIPLEIKGGKFSAGNNYVKFSTTGLNSGIYFVRCKNEAGQRFQKMIVM